MTNNAAPTRAKSVHKPQPPTSSRTEQIQDQISHLSSRDLQLWSIGLLVILVLTAGLLAFVMPNVIWAQKVIRIEEGYLPQLFFGLISLVLLFNIYLLTQKLSLNSTRRILIGELVQNERLESLSLIDPLTQLLNRRAMDQLIPKEVAHANRLGGNLTFMIIEMEKFVEINSKHGDIAGNNLLLEFSKQLKAVFRGGDTVFRSGPHEFFITMPDTAEAQGDPPLQRLLRSIEQWNLNNERPYELSFKWGFAQYVIGSDFENTLRTLDRKLYLAKNKMIPVF